MFDPKKQAFLDLSVLYLMIVSSGKKNGLHMFSFTTFRLE